jgi:hypothetical protein
VVLISSDLHAASFGSAAEAAGFDVDAVEPSAHMRDQLAVAAGRASIFEGTGESVPLPDASVDAVVCVLLPEPDRQALLDSVAGLADRHGLGDGFQLPYVTRCTRVRLR